MYYQQKITEVVDQFKSSITTGLSDQESTHRLEKYGYNRIMRTNKRNVLQLFFEQFKNLLVILLIAAAGISFFLGANRDGLILMMVVFFNALIGFYQDWKSENILASLKDLIIERCLVLRQGRKIEVPSEELVPGDIVSLSEGDGVPADIRLLESTGFSTNDFILTGESQPREKSAMAVLENGLGLSEQENCVFMGTTVAKGDATGIVVATGMQTELGKIAQSSEAIDASVTPLQKELNILAKRITYATLIICVILMFIRLFMGDMLNEALVFTIGVAAAMVPEGLPAQISVALALGVARLAKEKAIVKKLSSVEALGAATVIASDKTGTMTKNEMTIIHAYLNGSNYTVTGTGYEPKGEILDINIEQLHKENLEDLKIFILEGYLSSTGKINPPDKHHHSWYAMGDPTESAFSTLVLKARYTLEEVERDYPRIQLFQFDSFRKRASIIREHKGKHISFIKGSIESILEIADSTILGDEIKPLGELEKHHFLEIAKVHAAEAHRIIALGYKDLEVKEAYTIEEAETGAIFAGFVTMIDPPHEQVKEAIETAFTAGLKVFMITGDNEVTARAVANQVGMTNFDGTLPDVISNRQMLTLSDEEIMAEMKARTLIFSRVSPDEKLRIVSLLKQKGEVVAVTGDGVNDTLSLKKSDIGIAMGLSGSKVAQEAASMVLLNDDFSTIVLAIKEGRTIYKNLHKIVLANLIGNLAELMVILFGFVGAFWNMRMAILAVHILLIDLIGNMLPLLMLSFDPAEKNLMDQPPRKQGQMLNRENLILIIYSGIIKGILSFVAYLLSYAHHTGEPAQHEMAMTVTFTSIIVCHFVNVFSCRTDQTIFTSYFFSNINLFLGILLSTVFMLMISYIPTLNGLFHTGPMDWADWVFILGGALVYLAIFEIIKLLSNRKHA